MQDLFAHLLIDREVDGHDLANLLGAFAGLGGAEPHNSSCFISINDILLHFSFRQLSLVDVPSDALHSCLSLVVVEFESGEVVILIKVVG